MRPGAELAESELPVATCGEWCWVQECSCWGQAGISGCGAWTCERCRPKRVWRLILEICRGDPNRLLTLTTRFVEDGDKDAEAARQADCFKRLCKRYRREFRGKELEFFVVREAQENGWPHLHVALRSSYIPWEWLTARWQELSGSPGVFINTIWAGHGSAKYLAKYMGKDLHRFGNCKRYWKSEGYLIHDEPVRLAVDAWVAPMRRTVATLDDLYRCWEAEGKNPARTPDGRVEWGDKPAPTAVQDPKATAPACDPQSARAPPEIVWLGDMPDHGSRGRLCDELVAA